MKRLLLVSFDIMREKDAYTWYPVASLLTYLKNSKGYGSEFIAEVCSLNARDALQRGSDYVTSVLEEKCDASRAQWIALACSVWSKTMINPTMLALRKAGFKGIFILGGYEITGSQDLQDLIQKYPDGQVFIKGFAEASLLKSVQEDAAEYPVLLSEALDFAILPSPYLVGILPIPLYTPMIRWETKRGCPFHCGFCSYRGLTTNCVHYLPLDRIFSELEFFKEKKIQKINVIDPVFHIGKDYIQILQKIISLGMQTQFSFQCRLEIVSDEFLRLSSSFNSNLEFSLQTIHPKEFQAIGRKNDMAKIEKNLRKLKEYGVSYQVDLMYGLPFQTPDSFQESIEFCQKNGCEKPSLHPLRLCEGTELYERKNEKKFLGNTKFLWSQAVILLAEKTGIKCLSLQKDIKRKIHKVILVLVL